MSRKLHSLSNALASLESAKEYENFLRDLLTPVELAEFEKRFAIAQVLDEGEMSYLQIAEKLGTSTTTVTRVARFLHNEPFKGYKKVLAKLQNK